MTEPKFPESLAALGARLAAAREARGLTVEAVAEKLHCDAALVRLMDAGRFAEVGGAPVYARGHLRRYAELLGESPEEYTRRWQDLASAQIGSPDLTAIPKADRRAPDTRRALGVAGVVGAVLLFAALVAWILTSSGPPSAPATVELAPTTLPSAQPPVTPQEGSVESPSAAPAPDGPSNRVGAQAEAAAPATGAALSAVTDAAVANGAAPPAPTAEGTAAARQTASSTAIELRLQAQGACWFEVYDRDGRQLSFGLVNPGGTRTVRGLPPLRVVIGNAPAVRLEVQGRLTTIPPELVRSRAALLRIADDGSIVPVP